MPRFFNILIFIRVVLSQVTIYQDVWLEKKMSQVTKTIRPNDFKPSDCLP